MKDHPIAFAMFFFFLAIPLSVFIFLAPTQYNTIGPLDGLNHTVDMLWLKALAAPTAIILIVIAVYIMVVYDLIPEALNWWNNIRDSLLRTTDTLNYDRLRGQPPEMYSFLKQRLYTFILATGLDGKPLAGLSTPRGLVPLDFVTDDFLQYHNLADPLELKPLGHKDYSFNRAYSKFDKTPKYTYAQWFTEFCCMPVLPGLRAWAYAAAGNKAAHWYSVESHLDALEFFGIENVVKEIK